MATFTGTSGDDSLPPIGQDNSGNDTYFGLAGADYISAGAGDDIAYGGSENDYIDAGGGDDYLDGGTGADILIGNFGDDTYIVDNAGDAITEYSPDDGTDTIYSSVSYTLPQYVERLILTGGFNLSGTGGAAADTLVGNSGGNTLTGNAGADFLSGGDGNDVLRGGSGMDILDGGNGVDYVTYTENEVAVTVNLATGVGSGGNAQGDSYSSIENVNGSTVGDIIIGNASANVLNGWAGKDTLTGGGGADTFTFSQTSHSAVGANADRITDFSHAQGDRIDLSAIDADTTLAGNQAFAFIGTALYSGDAGELRYSIVGATTTVAGDVNGDGTSDFHIQLTGAIGLVVSDFVL
jgi:Ca2+-binding RTX toxin-like protein